MTDPSQPTRSAITVAGISGYSASSARTRGSNGENDVGAAFRSYFGGTSDATARPPSTCRYQVPAPPAAAEPRPPPTAGSAPNPPQRSPIQSVWVASFSTIVIALPSSAADIEASREMRTAVERDLREAGACTVAIPGQAMTSAPARHLSTVVVSTDRPKWRTGSEGRISYLKRGYGWERTRLDGRDGAAIWCEQWVFAPQPRQNRRPGQLTAKAKDTRKVTQQMAADPPRPSFQVEVANAEQIMGRIGVTFAVHESYLWDSREVSMPYASRLVMSSPQKEFWAAVTALAATRRLGRRRAKEPDRIE